MTVLGLPLLAGAALATLVGALAQRATGMGFALLAAPFLALLLGPASGIAVANVCGALAAAVSLAQTRHDLDTSRAAVLVPMGVLGILPGAIAVALLPAAPLTIAVAAVVLAGLGATMLLRGRTLPPSRPLAAVGGLAAGFMSVTAGVAGPGVVVYARATGWSQRGFAATAQLVFLVLSLVSLLARRTVPALPPAGWALLLLALVAGLVGGHLLAPRIDPERAMRAVLVAATAGALLALARGLAALLG